MMTTICFRCQRLLTLTWLNVVRASAAACGCGRVAWSSTKLWTTGALEATLITWTTAVSLDSATESGTNRQGQVIATFTTAVFWAGAGWKVGGAAILMIDNCSLLLFPEAAGTWMFVKSSLKRNILFPLMLSPLSLLAPIQACIAFSSTVGRIRATQRDIKHSHCAK